MWLPSTVLHFLPCPGAGQVIKDDPSHGHGLPAAWQAVPLDRVPLLLHGHRRGVNLRQQVLIAYHNKACRPQRPSGLLPVPLQLGARRLYECGAGRDQQAVRRRYGHAHDVLDELLDGVLLHPYHVCYQLSWAGGR